MSTVTQPLFTFSTTKVDIIAVYDALYRLGLIDKSKHNPPKQTSFRGITGSFTIYLNENKCLTMVDLNSLLMRFFDAVDIPDLDKRGQSFLLEHVLSHENSLVQHPLLITSELAQAVKLSISNALVDISEKVLKKMDKALPDVYGKSLLAYTFRRLIQIAHKEEETKAVIFDNADFMFGPAHTSSRGGVQKRTSTSLIPLRLFPRQMSMKPISRNSSVKCSGRLGMNFSLGFGRSLSSL